MKVALLYLGCKVNQAEMDRLEAGLRAGGHEIVGLDSGPELCIVNTCSVTAKSDYQSRQLIRRAAGLGAGVIVTGCYSEVNPAEAASINGVIKVIGNEEKTNISNYIEGVTSSSTFASSGRHSRYLLKIQDGCDYSCSYCLIPKARGRARSSPASEIIDEVKAAVDQGYKEVILTGIHIGLYGSDIDGKLTLLRLVEEILSKTDVFRLRLSSLEVNELDPAYIGLMKSGRVCNHLHVPVQSGSDKVLSLMRRPYKRAQIVDALERFASEIPDLGLGTDIIAGFPGEGDGEFQETVALARSLPFTYLHVFPYSERPGTDASALDGKVDHATKRARCKELRRTSAEKKTEFLKKMRGMAVDVLVEERVQGGFLGTSSNYIKVFIPSGRELPARSIENVTICGQKGPYALANPLILG